MCWPERRESSSSANTSCGRFPDPAKEAVLERFLENYFEQLTSEVGMLTYCGGLTGALEGLRYLGCRRLLEVDCSDVENHYREVLQNFAMQGHPERELRLPPRRSGSSCVLPRRHPFVNRALEALERTAEKTGTAWKWVSSLGTDRGTGYNICLSHGMSSIVSVLSRARRRGHRPRTARPHRDGCMRVHSVAGDRPAALRNFFPGQSLENDPEHPVYFSRLGWCYGDFGREPPRCGRRGVRCATTAGAQKALEVLRGTSRRRELAPNGIFDAGLCHGAASVALMYHYMYGQTGETLFAETRDYWIGETLRMGRLEEGPGRLRRMAWRGVRRMEARIRTPWRHRRNRADAAGRARERSEIGPVDAFLYAALSVAGRSLSGLSVPVSGRSGPAPYPYAAPIRNDEKRGDRFSLCALRAWILGPQPDRYADYAHGSGFDRTRIDSAARGILVVLGRVRGFVRYHHPAFAGERFDADCELFELLPRVADAARP